MTTGATRRSTSRRRRAAAMLAGLAVVAAACGRLGTTGGRESAGDGTPPPLTVPQVEPGPREDTPSALRRAGDDRFPPALIDVRELVPGGPPPDGIPSIDAPRFHPAADVRFLADNEPVLALEVGGDARAYPVQVLIWHEIVNDTVGGVPVAVTYCPLCNSAIAFDRRVDGRVLEFGTSGLLYRSALVMYDRQTESLWSHFTAKQWWAC